MARDSQRQVQGAMDKHLEEQIERVRRLSARLGEIQDGLAANSELISRERTSCTGTPIDDVRDLRVCGGPVHHRRKAPREVDSESSGARHRRRRTSRRR